MEMQAELLNVKESNSGEKVRCSAINKERSMVERQECWWLKEVGSMFGSDEKKGQQPEGKTEQRFRTIIKAERAQGYRNQTLSITLLVRMTLEKRREATTTTTTGKEREGRCGGGRIEGRD
jgi:hypothetical protein